MSEAAPLCVGCVIAPHDEARRRFVAQALLATVGMLTAAACGDGEIGGPSGPRNAPPLEGSLQVVLADFPALDAVGGIARVDGGSAVPVAVSRMGTNDYRAFSMICPHASFRPINIVAAGFVCPNHGARFAADGAWTGGQQTSSLREYMVIFNAGAGTLTVS